MPEIKFSEKERERLRSECDLSDNVIDELEQSVSIGKTALDRAYSRPTAKEERKTLNDIRKSISSLSMQLNQLNYFTEINIERNCAVGFGKVKDQFLKELDLLDDILAKVPLPKDKAGNKKLDDSLADFIFKVARVMVQNGITPKKRGKQFRAILRIVFEAIREKGSKIQTIVENSWDDVEDLIDFPDGEPDDWEEYLAQRRKKS